MLKLQKVTANIKQILIGRVKENFQVLQTLMSLLLTSFLLRGTCHFPSFLSYFDAMSIASRESYFCWEQLLITGCF